MRAAADEVAAHRVLEQAEDAAGATERNYAVAGSVSGKTVTAVITGTSGGSLATPAKFVGAGIQYGVTAVGGAKAESMLDAALDRHVGSIYEGKTEFRADLERSAAWYAPESGWRMSKDGGSVPVDDNYFSQRAEDYSDACDVLDKVMYPREAERREAYEKENL